jgi:organic radical activating enzyme
MNKLRLNTIYITYQGEVNHFGIGTHVFLRLQGCPIRCYKDTMGVLCDTPEALEKNNSLEVTEIVNRLKTLRSTQELILSV